MERKSFAQMDCSVAQCLEVVGEWWSMLIIRDCFMGVTGSKTSNAASASRGTS